jgi:ketosteroid isomerase-like protein
MSAWYQSSPGRRRLIALAAAAGIAGLLRPATPAVAAGENSGAAAASAALFADMTARDLPGVLRLVPANGFTEIGANSAEVHRLDAKAFEGLFKSGMAISLRMTGMQEQTFGDTAVVTGTRVGGIAPQGALPAEDRQLATLVWSRVGNGWQLRHIHLSAPSSTK